MTKHRSHSAAFQRQAAEEFIAGETLHALAQRHNISRQLTRCPPSEASLSQVMSLMLVMAATT